MLQFVAKNVGIRRAAGRFVLATNIDILLSAELAAALVEPFARGCLYRVDRYDVEFPFRDVHDVDEALAFCADHPLRYARRDGVYYASGRELPIYQSVSDFVAYETAHWYTRLRSPRTLSLDAPLRRDRKRLRYGSAAPNERTGRLDPARVKSLGYSILDRADAALSLATLPKLHVNACGDFTLMSRDDWFALRAYPEWIVHSWHLDTLLLHQAHASGLLFIELEPPLVVYHMEHGQGSGWTPEGHAEHFRRVETTGIHTLSSSELRRWKRQLRSERKRGKIVTLNDEDWGLGSASFDEVRLAEP
jgi:hypothetical protein